MFRRAAAVAALAAAVLVVGAGCTGSPDPVASTPAPLTEEEAFAAAEETYRAYVDALNQVNLADPDTFEPVYALTTGEANANERESLSQMHADKWSVSGKTVIDGFDGIDMTVNGEVLAVSARVCSNVSEVVVLDAAGQSQVSAQRPDRYSLEVEFAGEADALAIATSNAVEDPTCG